MRAMDMEIRSDYTGGVSGARGSATPGARDG
jgi:hypothetical protein